MFRCLPILWLHILRSHIRQFKHADRNNYVVLNEGKPCGKQLNCKQHRCPQPCHEGECPPCCKTSVQLCKCRRHQKTCDCAAPAWMCEEKCGKPLECGHHVCDQICCSSCPPCSLSQVKKFMLKTLERFIKYLQRLGLPEFVVTPFLKYTQVRTCPCGKSSHKLECTVATPTCGDTCGKPLGCPGGHVCVERCHRGKCGSCLQMVTKQCKCSILLQQQGERRGGERKKEVPCTKEFACETKCKRMRDCGRHACNRKCCIGDCPPCEQACNKQLPCKCHT